MTSSITYENWDEDHVVSLFKSQPDYMDILKWAYEEYKDDIVYACSFGAEGMVLIDLISKIRKNAKIIFLDTGLHFKETYELIDEVKKRYPNLEIKMVTPKASVEEQARWYGNELWLDNPNLCCHMRKVAPLSEALQSATAWISGLRREQSPMRSQIQFINKDEKFQKIKICPLIHWTWEDILTYIRLNQLPYNPLHDQGYPSIGCATCTKAVEGNHDLRSGRWVGHEKSECGLHLK
ncbi:phosphoadenylyl-sulfate reductase [Cytobacillus sp. Hz8]|uniref:phosphoadenylyl-sulfate reductase n=1 Tax=Cytobacillus sp. Hz8 TaxID=3347168 RepID=UPI0035D72637